MKRFIIGLLISGLLSYFAFKGVDWTILKESLTQMDYRYLLSVIPLNLLIQWMRSYRWGLILKPIKALDQGTLFSITSVGLMGGILLPARTGEFLRSHLISQQKQVDLRLALATVVVERVLDGLTIMGFFVWVILFIPLPPWVHRAGYLCLAVFLSALSLLIFAVKWKEGTLNLVRSLTKVFPRRTQNAIHAFIYSFTQGLQILPNWKRIGVAIGLSCHLGTDGPHLLYSFSMLSFQTPFDCRVCSPGGRCHWRDDTGRARVCWKFPPFLYPRSFLIRNTKVRSSQLLHHQPSDAGFVHLGVRRSLSSRC